VCVCVCTHVYETFRHKICDNIYILPTLNIIRIFQRTLYEQLTNNNK